MTRQTIKTMPPGNAAYNPPAMLPDAVSSEQWREYWRQNIGSWLLKPGIEKARLAPRLKRYMESRVLAPEEHFNQSEYSEV